MRSLFINIYWFIKCIIIIFKYSNIRRIREMKSGLRLRPSFFKSVERTILQNEVSKIECLFISRDYKSWAAIGKMALVESAAMLE